MCLIYINDLATGLSSNSRLFADEGSPFLVLRDMSLLAKVLKNGLLKINNWTYQWKMSFKSGPSKQTQEVFFF